MKYKKYKIWTRKREERRAAASGHAVILTDKFVITT